MIEIQVPGFKTLTIETLVCDYNGVLGTDGHLITGVAGKLEYLTEYLKIYILTADTYGTVRDETQGLPVELKIISGNNQAYTKQQFIRQMGKESTAAIGNGRNDALMLEEALLGIAVMGKEGASSQAINSSDLVVTSIIDALDLFINPVRIKAGMRT